MSTTHRAAGVAALTLALAGGALGGCSDDTPAATGPDPSPAAHSHTSRPSPTSPAASTTAGGPVDLEPIPGGTVLEPATYAVPFLGEDGPARAVVDVPDGYFSAGGWVIDDGHGQLAPDEYGDVMFFGSAERVALDPCHSGAGVEPAPGVRALADDLVAQANRQTTTPRAVTVDGHPGLYLESRATGSMAGCTTGTHRLLAAHSGDSFWLEDSMPGTTDHLWLLDVDGRLVVAVARVVRGRTEDPRELVGIARSMRFPGVHGTQRSLVEGPPVTLPPATYRFTTQSDRTEDPDALIDVPSGYDSEADWYVVSHDDRHEFLGLTAVSAVQPDPCEQGTTAQDPGPSVRDLADALVAQRHTDATEPRPVRLDGHRGLYLELRSPSDLSACQDAELWVGRGIYGGGQVDRLWILDVDGHRVVVDASHGPATTRREVVALTRMARSTRFVAPLRG